VFFLFGNLLCYSYTLKVCDFGLQTHFDVATDILGSTSFRYCAPEILFGGSWDTKSDVYR